MSGLQLGEKIKIQTKKTM